MASDDLPGGLGDDLAFARNLPRFPEGTAVGEFELLREIGRGGFGEVYLARHLGYGRLAALKFVPLADSRAGATPADGLTAPDPSAQLLPEVRSAAALNLANFVTVYGLRTGAVVLPDEAEARPETFIEMEYASGGNLAQWRDDPRLTPRQLVEWLVPVADAIDQAHALGELVHYDLKPQNILLFDPRAEADRGRLVPARLTPKVGDFGLAGLAADGRTPFGTDGFAPPEQRDPKRDVLRAEPRRRAAAIDGFALAATAAAMFDPDWCRPNMPPRCEPYSKADLDHLAAAGADADLVAVLAKQLDPDPRARYATVGDFAADLRRWLNGEAVAARNYRWAVWKAFKKQSRWVKAVVALLPVVVGVGLWLWVANAEEKGQRATAEASAQKALADKLAADVEAGKARTAQFAAEATAQSVRADALAVRAGRAHDAIVVAARTAARRGNWPDARRGYDAAIADAFPDARQLRVERLAVYAGLNDTPTLERELAELEATPDLGPLAAPLKLARGALLLCDVEKGEAGRTAMREAREVGRAAPPDLFTPADDAYAASLIQRKPTPVIAGLERAVALDPLHQPAQNALLLALIAAGRLDDARRKLTEVERLFPNATAPPVAHGLIAAIDLPPGLIRSAVVWAAVQQFEARRGQPAPALTEFLTHFADTLDRSIELMATLGPPPPQRVKELQAAALALGLAAGRALGPAALPVPTGRLLVEWMNDMLPLAELLGRGDDATHDRLRELMDGYPDALVRSLAAANRVFAALPVLRRRDVSPDELVRVRGLMAAAAAHAADAADAPHLFARSPQKHTARAFGLIADLCVLRWTPDPDPVHFDRVRRNLHRLVADSRGMGWDDHRDMGIFLIVQVTAVEQTPGLIADWKLDTPAGREAYRRRGRELYAAARSLLDAWAADGAAPDRYRMASDLLENWARAEWLFGVPPVAPPPRPADAATPPR